MLNNQGFPSNCPQTRVVLAKHGRIEAIVSLPDHAFRKSGAQNKTSILFFRKFTGQQKRTFDRAFSDCLAEYLEQYRSEGKCESYLILAMLSMGAGLRNYQMLIVGKKSLKHVWGYAPRSRQASLLGQTRSVPEAMSTRSRRLSVLSFSTLGNA